VIGEQGALLSVDAQLRWNLTPLAELSAGVNNLLNQRPALWTPAFDRQFYVGLSMRWSAQP
jgi:outer membrane receptor protein involved in Fe transport